MLAPSTGSLPPTKTRVSVRQMELLIARCWLVQILCELSQIHDTVCPVSCCWWFACGIFSQVCLSVSSVLWVVLLCAVGRQEQRRRDGQHQVRLQFQDPGHHVQSERPAGSCQASSLWWQGACVSYISWLLCGLHLMNYMIVLYSIPEIRYSHWQKSFYMKIA